MSEGRGVESGLEIPERLYPTYGLYSGRASSGVDHVPLVYRSDRLRVLGEAAFGTENWIQTTRRQIALKSSLDPYSLENLTFDPLAHVPERHRHVAEEYVAASSLEDIQRITDYLDETDTYARYLAEGGAAAFGVGILAGAVDPLILVPSGGVARGTSLAARMARLMSVGVGTAAVAEGVILHTNPKRENVEALANTGAAAILVGVLGPMARQRPRGEFEDMVRELGDELRVPEAGEPDPYLPHQARLSDQQVLADTGFARSERAELATPLVRMSRKVAGRLYEGEALSRQLVEVVEDGQVDVIEQYLDDLGVPPALHDAVIDGVSLGRGRQEMEESLEALLDEIVRNPLVSETLKGGVVEEIQEVLDSQGVPKYLQHDMLLHVSRKGGDLALERVAGSLASRLYKDGELLPKLVEVVSDGQVEVIEEYLNEVGIPARLHEDVIDSVAGGLRFRETSERLKRGLQKETLDPSLESVVMDGVVEDITKSLDALGIPRELQDDVLLHVSNRKAWLDAAEAGESLADSPDVRAVVELVGEGLERFYEGRKLRAELVEVVENGDVEVIEEYLDDVGVPRRLHDVVVDSVQARAAREEFEKALWKRAEEIWDEEVGADNVVTRIKDAEAAADPHQYRVRDLEETESKPIRLNEQNQSSVSLQDSGYTAEALSRMTPLLRLLVRSRSVMAQRLAQILFEHPFRTKQSALGIAVPQAVETRIKIEERYLGEALDGLDRAYYAYRERMAGLDREQPHSSQRVRWRIFKYQMADLRKGLEAVARDKRENPGNPWVHRLKLAVRGQGGVLSKAEFVEEVRAYLLNPEEFEPGVARWVRTNDPTVSPAELDALRMPEVEEAARQVQAFFGRYEDQLVEVGVPTIDNFVPLLWRKDVIELKFEEFTRVVADLMGEAWGGGEDFTVEAVELANRIVGEPDGRVLYGPFKSRHLRERTFEFPQDDPRVQQFLEMNLEEALRKYHRSVVPDIALLRAFGTLNFKEFFEGIRREYGRHIENLEMAYPQKTGESRAQYKVRIEGYGGKLRARLSEDLRDLQAGIDILRHSYDVGHANSGAAKWSRRIRRYNVLRHGGGFVVSSLTDPSFLVMVQGVERVLEAALPFLRGGEMKLALQHMGDDIGLVGPAFEMLLDTRSSGLADIGDMHGRAEMPDRLLAGATAKFFQINLMSPWNQTWKTFTGIVAGLRMMRAFKQVHDSGAWSPEDGDWLLSLGIDQSDARAMWVEWMRADGARRVEGESLDRGNGVYIPDLDFWRNQRLANKMRMALRNSIDHTIVTPTALGRPLAMHSWLGATLFQYRSFAFQATHSILIAGAQRRDAATLNGLALGVFLGGMVYMIKEIDAGRDPFEEDARTWLWNAVDRSGALAVLADVNNLVEDVTQGRWGVGAALGAKPTSRWAYRDATGMVMGPTGGLLNDVGKVVGDSVDLEWSDATKSAMCRLMPGQNLVGVKRLCRLSHGDDEQHSVGAQ